MLNEESKKKFTIVKQKEQKEQKRVEQEEGRKVRERKFWKVYFFF